MKYRRDFVTNSSSSSFILGTADDDVVTIDAVYQVIRSAYEEYYIHRNAAIEFLKKHSNIPIIYGQLPYPSRFKYCFCLKKKDADYDTRMHWNNWLHKKFGIDFYDRFNEYEKWIFTCNDYKSYETFWKTETKAHGGEAEFVSAPFSIMDFSNLSRIAMLHRSKDTSIEYRQYTADKTSDILNWYYPYFVQAKTYLPNNCEGCDCKGMCDEDSCHETADKIKDLKYEEGKECLHILGRICVLSEDGYLPSSVANKLERMSNYAELHMG